jgi:hypothetical protein
VTAENILRRLNSVLHLSQTDTIIGATVKKGVMVSLARTVLAVTGCVLWVFSCAPQYNAAGPKCSAEPAALSLGTVSAAAHTGGVLILRNTGGKPLLVTAVKSTCPCILPDCKAPLEIPSLGSTNIPVGLDLRKHARNDIHGYLLVESNDTATPLLQVEVTGEIEPEFVVEPQTLEFGIVKRGKSYVHTLTVRQSGPEPVSITGVETPPGITASVRQLSPAVHEISVTLVSDAEGRLASNITLLSNVARMPRFAVPISAEVTGIQCRIAPSIMVFDAVQPGGKAGTLTVAGEPTLDVRAACDIGDMTLTVARSAPGTFEVTAQVAPNAAPGNKVGRLTLTLTDDGLTETRVVNIYGKVR